MICGQTMLPAALTPAPTPARKARAKAPKPAPPGRTRRKYNSDEIRVLAADLSFHEKRAHVANVEERGIWPSAIRKLKGKALTNINNTGAIDHLSDDDRRDVLLARQIVNNQKTSLVFNRKQKRRADEVPGLQYEIKILKKSHTQSPPPLPPVTATGFEDHIAAALDSLATAHEVAAVPAVDPPGTLNLRERSPPPAPPPPSCDDDDFDGLCDIPVLL